MRQVEQRGFSLPELLVALLIFSVISTAAVYILRLSIDAREQVSEVNNRLSSIELARNLIKNDLAQIVIRPVRDEYGFPSGPAFQGGEFVDSELSRNNETRILAFVRRGWLNPDSIAPRSSLQYVEYLIQGNRLIRRTRPYLDDARGQKNIDHILLKDVSSVKIGFVRGETSRGLDITESWPVSDNIYTSPPKAIELRAVFERYGELRQLFWIGEFVATGGGNDS